MERSTAPPAHICILRSGAGRASARDQSNLTLKGPVSLRNRFHEAGVVDYWLIREPSSTWCRGLGAWNSLGLFGFTLGLGHSLASLYPASGRGPALRPVRRAS